MTRSDVFTIVSMNDGSERVFVYRGTPAYGSLVAYRVPVASADGGLDPFANGYAQGEWCAPGYELVRATEVWPGVMLRAAPTVAQ